MISQIYLNFLGLYSVAFTDIIQLICIFVGLIFSIPWMTGHDAVTMPLQASNVSMFGDDQTYSKFYGKLERNDVGVWVWKLHQLFFYNNVLKVCSRKY